MHWSKIKKKRLHIFEIRFSFSWGLKKTKRKQKSEIHPVVSKKLGIDRKERTKCCFRIFRAIWWNSHDFLKKLPINSTKIVVSVIHSTKNHAWIRLVRVPKKKKLHIIARNTYSSFGLRSYNKRNKTKLRGYIGIR